MDKVTWQDYGEDLGANLENLLARVHSGTYRASPSRRAYISKPDGRKRPLGIATLEDKVLQCAVVEVLNAVYEVDFLGFSYGFRPRRSPHNALDGHCQLEQSEGDFRRFASAIQQVVCDV